MAIKGKLEERVEIKTSAQEYHDVFNGKPHHLANVTLDKVNGCTLHSGDLGAPLTLQSNGTTIMGKEKSTKCIIEVDDGKYKVVYKIIGGDFSEEYNNFHVTYDAIPKPEDGEFLYDLTKDIDAHYQDRVASAAK
ncbi:hypothetical protein QQ045_007948 [Rhodiola kirilowii]